MKKYRPLAIITIIAGLLLIGATALAFVRPPLSIDTAIGLWLHANATGFLDNIMHMFDVVGDVGIVMIAFLLLTGLFCALRQWRTAIFVASTGLAAALLNIGLKVLVQRPRPDLWPIDTDSTYSFPSGHTLLSSTILLVVIVLAWRTKWRWPVAVVASTLMLLMGLSRLYLGEHYLSDVVASFCVAVLLVVGSATLLLRKK